MDNPTMNRRQAINYLSNRTGIGKAQVEVLLDQLLEQTPNLLYFSEEQILAKFKQVAPAASSSGEESNEASSEEESEETQTLKVLLKQASLVVSDAFVDQLVQQYHQIQQRLKAKAICLRWVLLDDDQREEVNKRLLEGMAAITFYIISNELGTTQNQITGGEAAFTQAMQGRTIILHGSFLFGAKDSKTPPNDMDVIDTGAKQVKEAPLIKLDRETQTGKMTIGKNYTLVDVMVGIPLWGTDTLTGQTAKVLWQAVADYVRDYLQAVEVKKEGEESKSYRKLVNIAIILDYFIEQLTGVASSLRTYITRANGAITGRYPKEISITTNQLLKEQCQLVLTQVKKLAQ